MKKSVLKITPMDDNIERFKNACENGDLKTVWELFDVVNGKVDILDMRNLVTRNGHLNILKLLHKNDIDINRLYCDDNPFIIATINGWVDTESRPRQRGLDDAKFNHARVVLITHA